MAIEDDNKGSTATGSWVGKGTGSGATEADQRRQTLGTEGTSDHIDESHPGSGSEGGLGSGLSSADDGLGSQTGTQSTGQSSTFETSGQGTSSGTTGSMGGMAAEAGLRPEQGTSSTSEGVFQAWETSANPLIASNRVEGTAVYSMSRDRLGTIQHIMIDKLSGQSEFAVMSFGGFLGIGSDYYPIPWNKLTYDTEAGGYIVDITQEQLSDAPRYAADDEPDYGSDYSGQIGRHYGL